MKRAMVTILTVAVLAACVVPASAQTEPNLAKRPDEALVKLGKQLSSRFGKREALAKEPAVVLLRDDVILTSEDGYTIVTGAVVRLREKPDGDFTRSFVVPADAEIAEAGVWIVRKGKVERPEGQLWSETHENGVRRLVFKVPDVKKKDHVGMAFAELHPGGGFPGDLVPAWADEPVMMRRVRVKAQGETAYRIEGWRLPRDGWSLKTLEEKEGVAIDERFTLMDVEAGSAVTDGAGPWAERPFLMVAPAGRWNPFMNQYFFQSSWNEIAVAASQMLAGVEKEAGAFQAKATEIVGAETEPAARMAALHGWVQTALAEVDPFDRSHERGQLSALLAGGRATAGEQGLVLYLLGKSLGLDLEVLVSRRADMGSIKQGMPMINQLNDVVVRLKGDAPLYYYPAVDDCPAGEVPDRLHGCKALLVREGLLEEMMALQKEVMASGAASPEAGLAAYKAAIAEQDFAVWEKLP